MVENIINNRVDRYRLTDTMLSVQVPPVSPSKFDHNLAPDLKQSGRVDLVTLSKMWLSAIRALQRAMGAYTGMRMYI